MHLFALKTWMRARFGREHGASLVEYVFMVLIIAVACLFAVKFFGENVSQNFDSSGQRISGS